MSNRLTGLEFAVLPGVYNGFTAMLAERLGAKAVYLSGGALTSSMGIPDIGLITLDQLTQTVRSIRDAVDIPLVVDADTGFGEPLNVWKCVRALETAGADAIQIEDQRMPKKCGHLDGKEVIPPDAMKQKIRAAVNARSRALIIARTDSRAVNGFDDAVERANAYFSEGADIVFPEALTERREFARFAKSVEGPLLANMTEFGKTPLISAKEFKRMGYRFVIFPVTAFRAAARAEERAISAILKQGTQKGVMDDLMRRSEQYEVIRYDDYTRMDRTFSRPKRSRRK